MRKYTVIIVLFALAIVVGLRVYGPYHDSAVFRQKLDDISHGALDKDNAALSAEIAAKAQEVSLSIPEGGVEINRPPDGQSVEIKVAYQGVIDLFFFRHTVDFAASVTRELSFPAKMIKKSKESVEKSVQEHGEALDEKMRQIGQ